MQFNPRYPTLPARLYHMQQPLPLKGAKAGHFNAALAKELQWTAEEQQHWIEFCSGQTTFQEFPALAMVSISSGRPPVTPEFWFGCCKECVTSKITGEYALIVGIPRKSTTRSV